jgi:hypothetical protein
MLYELYGVLAKSGHNVYLSRARSLKCIDAHRTGFLNAGIYPRYIILKKEHVHSVPIGCIIGDSREKNAYAGISFVSGVNPTQQKYGPEFWEKNWG